MQKLHYGVQSRIFFLTKKRKYRSFLMDDMSLLKLPSRIYFAENGSKKPCIGVRFGDKQGSLEMLNVCLPQFRHTRHTAAYRGTERVAFRAKIRQFPHGPDARFLGLRQRATLRTPPRTAYKGTRQLERLHRISKFWKLISSKL